VKGANLIHRKKSAGLASDEVKNIKVEGMTCQNCSLKVETALLKMDGINETDIDVATGSVKLKGHNIDLGKVKKVVEDTGYKYSSEQA
jgi:copper chaperone CopZ